MAGFAAFLRRFLLPVLLIGTLAAVSDLRSQTTTAVILGTVTDTSGAVAPNATVQIANVGTGQTQTATTDSQGRYNVPDLLVGTYNVQASESGFQTMLKKGVTLTVGGQTVIDFTLQVGQAQETITVEANAVQVNTTTSEISTLMSQQQMSELPLNGRNFEQLITLGIGVQNISTNNHGSFYGNGNTYSVAGSRPEGAIELLDDTPLNTFWNHGSGAVSLGTAMGVEAIGEFQMLVNTYTAQFGGNGAVINATTKSGTNAFHGSLYEFLRNNDLDARNFNDGPNVPETRKNQFGVSVGGPVKKDKIFFFTNYEGLQQVLGSTQTAFVPDAAARQGYLPNSAGTAYTPFTGAAVGTGNCTAVYASTSNCVTNSLVAQILSIYPTSTASGLKSGGVVQVPQVANTPGKENYGVARIDYNISDKDSLFGRYIIDNASRISPFNPEATAIPYWPEEDFTRNQYIVLEERHLFSANLINLARAAFSRPNQYAIGSPTPPANAPPSVSSLFLIPGREQAQLAVTGLSVIGVDNLHLPYNLGLNRFSWGDDVLWTLGSHSVRFGLQVDRVQYNDQGPFYLGGGYSFNSLGSLLAGSAASYSATVQGVNDAFRYVRETELLPYIQDEWRVSRRLTLNLGLRYEFMNNPSCTPCTLLGPNGNVAAAVPTAPNFGYQTVSNVFAKNPSLGNFAPRVGFAFDPFGDHKTAIRGGFGEFYDLIEARTYMPGLWAAPPAYGLTFTNPTTFPVPSSSVTSSALTAFPALVSAQPLTSPGDPVWSATRTPHMLQWNMNVQHEFWDHTVFTVGYVGSSGIDLVQALNINAPLANANGLYSTLSSAGKVLLNSRVNSNLLPGSGVQAYGAVSVDQMGGHSSYNALQTSLNHALSHDVMMQLNYTWSKCMDNNSVTTGQELRSANPSGTNPYDQALNRGRCGFDVTQTVRLNSVIALPFQGNRLKTGWQLTPILSWSTGSPFDVTEGVTNWDGLGVNRPNLVPGCNPMAGAGTANQWFNPACFSLQPVGTLGNFGRDVLNVPGTFDIDLGVAKDTRITERYRVQFRAEFFNILNHTNLGAPTASGNFSLNSSCLAAGGSVASCATIPATQAVITQPNPGALSREIQFGLKLLF